MINTVLQAMRNAIHAQPALHNMGIKLCLDSPTAVMIGYGGLTVAHARTLIPNALTELNASEVDHGNLYSTDGSIDTTVSFKHNGQQLRIVTCYGQ